MEAATQSGAESIHERLMERMSPSEPATEEVSEQDDVVLSDETEQEEVAEVEAQAETEEVVEETVDAEPASSDESTEDGEPLELDALAGYLGIDTDKLDVDDDGGLLVRTKIDGEEGQAKLTDLLKSYQLEGHLNKQNMAVAEQQKALQTQKAELESQVQSKVDQLENLSQLAYNELLSEYNSIKWDELRTEDPAEYAAKLADYQTKQSRIANMYQQAQAEKPSTEPTQEVIQEQAGKLLDAFPEWKKDPKAYEQDYAHIGQYALSQGFSTDEFNSTLDHRMIVLLNKARQFDALKESSPKVIKRVRKAPKLAKPGSTARPKATKDQLAIKQRQAIKKTGGGKDLHDYLLTKV